MRRIALVTVTAMVLGLSASVAHATAPTLQSVGQTSGHITATWTLAAGTEARVIEAATSPATGSDGYFFGENVKEFSTLEPSQTSYTATYQNDPGTYYVHVASYDPNCSTSCPPREWSNVLAVTIPAPTPPASATPTPTGPPPDAVVSSRPTFGVANATSDVLLLTVAMSRHPDVKTAGEDAGAFLSDDAFETWLIPDDLVDGLARWPSDRRLDAGKWYWHAHLNSGNGYDWTPVTRIVVRDEAPLVTGWRLNLRRMKATKRCMRRVRVNGRATYEDNSPASERKTWVLKLKRGGTTVARLTGSDNYGTIGLKGVTCARRLGRLTATLAIVDAADHVALAPRKVVTVRG